MASSLIAILELEREGEVVATQTGQHAPTPRQGIYLSQPGYRAIPPTLPLEIRPTFHTYLAGRISHYYIDIKAHGPALFLSALQAAAHPRR